MNKTTLRSLSVATVAAVGLASLVLPGHAAVRPVKHALGGGELLVVLKSEAEAPAHATRLGRALGARHAGAFLRGRTHLFRLPAGRSTESAIAALKNDPAVAVVQPNYVYRALGT